MAEKYEGVKRNRKEIFTNNFVGGLAWGIGATLGLSFLIALLGLLVKYIDLVPYIGNFVSQIIEFIINKNPELLSLLQPYIFMQFVYA